MKEVDIMGTFKEIEIDMLFNGLSLEEAQARMQKIREDAEADRAQYKQFVDCILYQIDNPDKLSFDERIRMGEANSEAMRLYRLRQDEAYSLFRGNEFDGVDAEFLSLMQGSAGDSQAHFDDSYL